MATFKSDLVENIKLRPVTTSACAGMVVKQHAVADIPDTHAANDIIQLGVLPKGHVLVDCYLATDELDTHGTDTLAYDMGVLNSTADGLVANTKIISAGKMEVAKIARMNSVEGITNIAASDADRIIAVKITTVAATKADGKVAIVLQYAAQE